MTTFVRTGDSILNYSKKNNPTKSKLIISKTIRPNCLKKSSSMPDVNCYNTKYTTKFTATKYTNTKYTNTKYTNTKYSTIYNNNINSSVDSRHLPKLNDNSINNLNFYNSRQNNYKIFSDLSNFVKFHSFNKRDYIRVAQNIIKKRRESRNHDLLGYKSKTKNTIISDCKEISLNNYYIDTIKNYMNNMSLKESNYQRSINKSKDEFENDYRTFVEFVEQYKNTKKIEKEKLWRSKKKYEEVNDK